MIDMVAIQKPYILISYQNILFTYRTYTVTNACSMNITLLIFSPLRFKEIKTLTHRLWFCWIESVLILRQTFSLYINFNSMILRSFKQENKEFLTIHINTAFIPLQNHQTLTFFLLLNKKYLKTTIYINYWLKTLSYQLNKVIHVFNLLKLFLGNNNIEQNLYKDILVLWLIILIILLLRYIQQML